MQNISSTRMQLLCLVALTATLVVAGCAEQSVELPEPFTRVRTERKFFPVRVPLRMDILFVVDTSPVMQSMRTTLAANARNFANVLNSISGGLPDVHIAVISSDMGTAGGASAAGCSSHGDNGSFYTGSLLFTDGQAFLVDQQERGVPQQRSQNYQGSLTNALVNLLTLPPSTCRYAQPLRAISRALFPLPGEPGSIGNQSGAGTAGFIRSDALLAVVVLSANDDCSLAPNFLSQQIPDSQATAFRCFAESITCDEDATTIGPHHNCRPNPKPGALSATILKNKLLELKGARANATLLISMAVGYVPDLTQVDVAPTANPEVPRLVEACTSSGSGASVGASPSLRLAEFAANFRINGTASICNEDLSDVLTLVASRSSHTLGVPCFDGKLVEPFDCAFTEYRDYGEPQQRERLLPLCDALKSNSPCIRIATDPVRCPEPSPGMSVSFESGRSEVFPGTVIGVECVTMD